MSTQAARTHPVSSPRHIAASMKTQLLSAPPHPIYSPSPSIYVYRREIPLPGILSTIFKLLAAAALLAGVAFAQSTPPPTVEQRLNALDAATKAAQLSGDNAWMLTSAALVLMMTGPGLALFYGGLVRPKNVLSTMMHSFALMGVVTVIWAIYGYSLAFAPGKPLHRRRSLPFPQRRWLRSESRLWSYHPA